MTLTSKSDNVKITSKKIASLKKRGFIKELEILKILEILEKINE